MIETKKNDVATVDSTFDRSILNKITTLTVCLTPVLCIYRFLGVFMLGEILLIILTAINIFSTNITNKNVSPKQLVVILFATCVFAISCFGYFFNSVSIAILPRLIRLLFCLIVAALLGGYFFEYELAKKYIVWISVIATILIIFQKIYHDATGDFVYFLLRNNIYSNVYNSSYFQSVESLSVYRPMSIFLEPSHYCQYVLVGLTIVLAKNEYSLKNFLVAVFISMGIVISTSSTGVIICLLIWCCYLLLLLRNTLHKGTFNAKMLFAIALVMVAAIVIFLQFGDRFLFAIERIYGSSSTGSTDAWDSRLGTFSVFFETNRISDFIIGKGYGVINENEWYASIPYYFSGTGIVGIFLLTMFFISLFALSNKVQKKILILMFILCLATEILTNYWLIFMLPLIMTATEEKGKE